MTVGLNNLLSVNIFPGPKFNFFGIKYLFVNYLHFKKSFYIKYVIKVTIYSQYGLNDARSVWNLILHFVYIEIDCASGEIKTATHLGVKQYNFVTKIWTEKKIKTIISQIQTNNSNSTLTFIHMSDSWLNTYLIGGVEILTEFVSGNGLHTLRGGSTKFFIDRITTSNLCCFLSSNWSHILQNKSAHKYNHNKSRSKSINQNRF